MRCATSSPEAVPRREDRGSGNATTGSSATLAANKRRVERIGQADCGGEQWAGVRDREPGVRGRVPSAAAGSQSRSKHTRAGFTASPIIFAARIRDSARSSLRFGARSSAAVHSVSMPSHRPSTSSASTTSRASLSVAGTFASVSSWITRSAMAGSRAPSGSDLVASATTCSCDPSLTWTRSCSAGSPRLRRCKRARPDGES